MYTLTLMLDVQKDAWNRYDSCNKTSQGIDRKSKIDSTISEKISGKEKQEAYNFLIPYLENYYKNNEQNINNTIQFGQEIINKNINDACNKLEEITNTKIYKQNFIGYITTFPRGPYNKENGYIRLYYNRSIKYYIGFFLHELLHFQFIHYYTNHSAIIDLNEQEFNTLKESLTIILNYELKNFLGKPDEGYTVHKNLREKLDIFRQNNKSFEELVIYGSNIIKQSRIK